MITDDLFWYYHANDPNRFLVSIALSTTPIELSDSDLSTCSFTISESTSSHLFKAKSKIELNAWVDTINSRRILCSENDVFFMAEELCSMGENRKSCRDIDFLSECASFEGTLLNRLDLLFICYPSPVLTYPVSFSS
jgi:hypothetical protein